MQCIYIIIIDEEEINLRLWNVLWEPCLLKGNTICTCVKRVKTTDMPLSYMSLQKISGFYYIYSPDQHIPASVLWLLLKSAVEMVTLLHIAGVWWVYSYSDLCFFSYRQMHLGLVFVHLYSIACVFLHFEVFYSKKQTNKQSLRYTNNKVPFSWIELNDILIPVMAQLFHTYICIFFLIIKITFDYQV